GFAADPVELELDARVVERVGVGDDLALLCVDDVARVADVHEAAVGTVQEGPDPAAGARARALVTRDGPRKAHVVEVSRRRTWKSADVVDMRDAVRSIECPELRPVRCEREPVGGWIRPEPW